MNQPPHSPPHPVSNVCTNPTAEKERRQWIDLRIFVQLCESNRPLSCDARVRLDPDDDGRLTVNVQDADSSNRDDIHLELSTSNPTSISYDIGTGGPARGFSALKCPARIPPGRTGAPGVK